MAPRFALVTPTTRPLAEIAAYMPSNYYVARETPEGWLIAGSDSAGWTLDDYIKPRLLSGSIGSKEITKQKALALGFVAEPFVIFNEEALFWSNLDGWVDLASATHFGRHEVPSLNLPESAYSQWIALDQADEIDARRRKHEEPSLP